MAVSIKEMVPVRERQYCTVWRLVSCKKSPTYWWYTPHAPFFCWLSYSLSHFAEEIRARWYLGRTPWTPRAFIVYPKQFRIRHSRYTGTSIHRSGVLYYILYTFYWLLIKYPGVSLAQQNSISGDRSKRQDSWHFRASCRKFNLEPRHRPVVSICIQIIWTWVVKSHQPIFIFIYEFNPKAPIIFQKLVILYQEKSREVFETEAGREAVNILNKIQVIVILRENCGDWWISAFCYPAQVMPDRV